MFTIINNISPEVDKFSFLVTKPGPVTTSISCDTRLETVQILKLIFSSILGTDLNTRIKEPLCKGK
jgi:hypothetical protein